MSGEYSLLEDLEIGQKAKKHTKGIIQGFKDSTKKNSGFTTQNWVFLWINVGKAAGMLVLSIIALAVGLKDVNKLFPVVRTSSILEGPQTLEDLNELNLVPLAAISSLILFAYACFNILICFYAFEDIIRAKQNAARWVAYALSQPFQVFLVIILVGINEITSIVIFFMLQFTFVLIQAFLERISTDPKAKHKWIRFGLICAILVIHIAIWFLIFFDTYYTSAHIPDVIQVAVIGTFVFITVTAITNFVNTFINLYYANELSFFILLIVYDSIEVLYAVYFVLAFTIGVTTFPNS